MRRIRCFLCALIVPFSCLAQNDAGGAIKVTTIMHDDGSKTVTRVDPDQRTSSAETFDGAGKLRQRVVYQLDDQNQAESGLIYAANGALIMKSVYKRDGMNRIAEEVDYLPNGTLLRRFVYEFGSKGTVSRIRAFDANGNELQQSGAKPDRKQAPPQRRR